MKTPAELIADANIALGQMGDLSGSVHDYASMLGVLMAGPDAENAMAGMHRVALEIRSLAEELRARHDEAWQAVQRLAKP